MKIERKWASGGFWQEINYSTLILDLAKHIEGESKAEARLVQVLNAFVCLTILHSFETHEALYRLTEYEANFPGVDWFAERITGLKEENEQLRARFRDQCRIIEEKRLIIQSIREWALGWYDCFDTNKFDQGKADGARDVLRLINSGGTGEGLKPGASYGGGTYSEQVKPCGCLPSDMCDCEESARLQENEDLKALGLLTDFVREVARWREKVHEYDEDQGHEPRHFSDEEEWGLLEHHARRVLRDCGIEEEG